MRVLKLFAVVFVMMMTASVAVAQEPVEFSPAQEISPGVWMAQTISPEDFGSCIPNEEVLCLQRGRFTIYVTVDWYDEDYFFGKVQHRLSDTSGTFYFYSLDNTEIVLKILNGCWLNGRYWIFITGLTDRPIVISVIDEFTDTITEYSTMGGYPLVWRDTEVGFPCLN
jgi:hypothetical protein